MGSSMEKKRVVVVGGGVAGSLLAYTLQNYCDVFLIDSKEYFEITWASLRAMVEPSFAKRSVINHHEYLRNARVVSSPAVDITDSEVLTAQGRLIAYDYLVVATGHMEDGPVTTEERLDFYQTEHEKIKSASSVLIVGGGPTGVELAGEIAVDFPNKKVILVHRGSRLLDFLGEKAGKKALDWLISKNVEVIMGQSVELDSASNGVYRLSGGETVVADCHFLCTGKPFGTSWLKDTILKGSLDVHGKLVVDSNLRVEGFNNIFAIGDIVNTKINKRGETVDEKIKKLDTELARCREQIKKTRPGPAQEVIKARAMRILKQKRVYEGQRDMLYNQTCSLDQVAFASEETKDAKKNAEDELGLPTAPQASIRGF